MRRRHAGENVEAFRRRLHWSEGGAIRDQIAAWAKSAAADIKWPVLPPQIADRDADIWEPLIAIADAVGGEWPDRVRAAGVALVADTKELEPSPGIKLLSDLQTVFGSNDELSSKAVLQALHALEESPWADLKGKPLDQRGLASRLRQYGVRSKTIRIGNTTPKGYSRADFTDVWARYLPPPSSATSATSAISTSPWNWHRPAAPARSSVGPADVASVAAPKAIEPVCDHCRTADGSLCQASIGGEPLWLHPECVDAYAQADARSAE
jgi:hypothetical protein